MVAGLKTWLVCECFAQARRYQRRRTSNLDSLGRLVKGEKKEFSFWLRRSAKSAEKKRPQPMQTARATAKRVCTDFEPCTFSTDYLAICGPAGATLERRLDSSKHIMAQLLFPAQRRIRRAQPAATFQLPDFAWRLSHVLMGLFGPQCHNRIDMGGSPARRERRRQCR
jgi:hypothetical protein